MIIKTGIFLYLVVGGEAANNEIQKMILGRKNADCVNPNIVDALIGYRLSTIGYFRLERAAHDS